MKAVLLCFVCLPVCLQLTHAQNSMGVQNDLKGLMSTRANVSGAVISSFGDNTIKGNRYLFDDWTNGSVVSVNGEAYSQNYGFNFDKINQDVYAKDNSTGVTVLLDKTKIRRFKIGAIAFVGFASSKTLDRNVFYQVLAEDTAKLSLYKLTATKFVKADPNNIMNVRTGNSTSEYVDDLSYYVSVRNGELKKIGLSENNIRKTLKEKADKVEAYLSANATKEVDEAFLTGLVQYVNQ